MAVAVLGVVEAVELADSVDEVVVVVPEPAGGIEITWLPTV